MKKILLFLGLFLLALPVKAKTVYSDYSDFSAWQESEVKATDTIKVETKKRYKYYYLKSLDGGFFGRNDDYQDFNFLSLEDKKYGAWSAWQDDEIKGDMYREVEVKKAYLYSKAKGIRYVYINHIKGSNNHLIINELSFDVKGKTVYPKINTCTGCNSTFYPYIFNGVLNQNMSMIDNDGSIILDLGDYYNLSDINMNIWLYDETNANKEFTVYYMHNLDINKPFVHYDFLTDYTNKSINDTPVTKLSIDMFAIDGNIEFNDPVISLDEVKEDDFTRVNIINAYRSREIAYLRYKNIPVYSDYLDNATTNYPIQSNDYKLYYRYATRHYFNVADDITLKDNNLKQYIESDVPYKIDSNIDLTKNGSYDVTISNDYLRYTFPVKVDVDSDKDKQINANTEEIKELNNEINALEEANGYLNTTIDLKEAEKQDLRHDYENKLESKNNIISNLSNQKEASVSIKSSSFGTNDTFYIGLGILFVSLLVATYIYFRK
jgi:hypothetical protein